MKKLLTLILIFSVLTCISSCYDYAEHPSYENITYKEDGFEIVLMSDMQRYDSTEYDFYFTNIIGTIIVGASKIDEEFLAKNGLDSDTDAGEYIDFLIKKSELDKESLYYNYDDKRGIYNFRYTYSPADASEIFYYFCALGEAGNLWYVEMMCSPDDSDTYIPRFDKWRKSLGTYKVEE